MKHILYTCVACLAALLFACQEDEADTWHGEDGVYFYVQWPYGTLVNLDSTAWPVQPYTSVNFFEEGSDTLQVPIRVRLAGNIADHDRQFRIVVDQDSTTAATGNYVVPEEYQVMPANSYYTDVLVTIIASSALEDEELQLGLRLEPTDELTVAIPVWEKLSDMYAPESGAESQDGSFHAIRMNDFITRPAGWTQANPNPQVGDLEAGYLGFFSRKKYDYILEHFPELTYEDFASAATMPIARQRSIANVIAGYLTAAYNAKEYVLEDDGRLMWVMGCGWNSYYGVPFVPAN